MGLAKLSRVNTSLDDLVDDLLVSAAALAYFFGVRRLQPRQLSIGDVSLALPRRVPFHMCGDCRVVVQTESKLDPYAGPPRPHPRTTDEYEAAHDLPPGEKKKPN